MSLPGLTALVAMMLVVTMLIRRHAKNAAPFAIVRDLGEDRFEGVERDGRRIALKRLPAAPDTKATGLRHPGLAEVHGIVGHQGACYVVFEALEGKTVEEVLRERGRLGLAETQAILEPVCRALEFAHEQGVVHGDVRPANVLITSLGFVKVLECGFSRRAVTPKGDVEALGLMACQMMGQREELLGLSTLAEFRERLSAIK